MEMLSLNELRHIKELFTLVQLNPRSPYERFPVNNNQLLIRHVKVLHPLLDVEVVQAVANKFVLLEQVSGVRLENVLKVSVVAVTFAFEMMAALAD